MPQAARSLCFSPDGRLLATAFAASRMAAIFDAASGRQLALLSGHKGDATACAFACYGGGPATSTGVLATASEDRTVRLVDVAAALQAADEDVQLQVGGWGLGEGSGGGGEGGRLGPGSPSVFRFATSCDGCLGSDAPTPCCL